MMSWQKPKVEAANSAFCILHSALCILQMLNCCIRRPQRMGNCECRHGSMQCCLRFWLEPPDYGQYIACLAKSLSLAHRCTAGDSSVSDCPMNDGCVEGISKGYLHFVGLLLKFYKLSKVPEQNSDDSLWMNKNHKKYIYIELSLEVAHPWIQIFQTTSPLLFL